MDDLRKRFAALDQLPVPDLSGEVDRRVLRNAGQPVVSGVRPRLRWRESAAGTPIAGRRPTTMLARLAVAATTALLGIGVLGIGASLLNSDNETGRCPATFDEADAIDTSGDGLSQAQRAWGIAGGVPGRVRPGVIAAYAADPANAPLSVITIDPTTRRQCRLVRLSDHIIGRPATSLDWSPTGNALAIGFHDEDDEGTHGQVLIWTPDRLIRVWSGTGTPGLEWAPDGRSVAVWRALPLQFGGSAPPAETRVIFADGSPDRRYGVRPFADGFEWAPDGTRWLVIQGTVSSMPTSVSIVDVIDGRVTPIDLPTGTFDAIGWIDDDRVLLSELTDPGMRYLNLPVAAPADFASLPVPDEGLSSKLVLSPDGKRVAYTTTSGLVILGLETGSTSDPVRVAAAAGDLPPSWSPDGTQVLFTGAGASWVVDADGTGLRQLVSGNIHPFDDPWQAVPVP